MTDIRVTRNDEASRYEVFSGDDLAGFAEFEHRPGEIAFTHTEVDQEFRGDGIAAQLARESLKDAAASGDAIVPECSFIEVYLRTHPLEGAEVRWPQR